MRYIGEEREVCCPCREAGALLFGLGGLQFAYVFLHAFFYLVLVDQQDTSVVGKKHHVLAGGVVAAEVFAPAALE
jgi:hypothetical protein